MELNRSAIRKFVEQAARARLHGSFSERHPFLGKKIRCPFCHQRRYRGEKCCSAAYSTSQRAWSPEKGFYQIACEPRVTQAIFPKPSRRRKHSHTHSGGRRQGPVNWIHQVILEFQAEPYLPGSTHCSKCLVEGIHKMDADKAGQLVCPSCWRCFTPKDVMLPGPKLATAIAEMNYGFGVPQEHIPVFAEKYVLWKIRQQKRAERKRHRLARRINFGLEG